MKNNSPPDLQKKIQDFQNLQMNLQSLNEQKIHMEIQLKDVEEVSKILNNIEKDTPIYKSVGGFMIATPREQAIEDLKDKKSILTTRIKSVTMSIEKIQQKYDKLKNEIKERMK
ncbi:MAG: prefoldin subunit beta [Promethearchaeota archaeon]